MGHPTSALFTRGKIPLLIGAGAVLGALAAVAPLLAQQPTIPTSNVNVIAGTGPDGDWTLQRQNEPAGACSSRNPLNCMVGANDYRTRRHSVPGRCESRHRRRLARVGTRRRMVD